MKRRSLVDAAIAVVLTPAITASAGLVEVGQFAGTMSETWESFPPGWQTPPVSPPGSEYSVSIMSGRAAVVSYNVLVYSSGGADMGSSGLVQASDGAHVTYFTQAEGFPKVSVEFSTPVRDFGAYWGSFTGYPGHPAPPVAAFHLTFQDGAGLTVGTADFNYVRPGDGLLEWHGWTSDQPFKKVVVNTTQQVFMDGLQANVPEPSGIALVTGLGLVSLALWRRRRC